MSLTGEFKLKAGKETFTLKATILAIYKAMADLECDNKMSNLLSLIDQMDLKAIYTLLKHCSNTDRDIEELMELPINLSDLAEAIGQVLQYSVNPTGKK